MIGYAVGNSAGPQYWQKKYQPRNHVPWTVIGICYVICPLLMLIIRWLLKRENEARNREEPQEYEEVYIQEEDEKGEIIERKVDKEFLDLTDRQNRDFR